MINSEIQLDYSDVLIVPKHNYFTSRKDVSITRTYQFPWSPYQLQTTGIMNANMYNTGNISVSKAMIQSNLCACLHKFHTVEELKQYFTYLKSNNYSLLTSFISIGLHNKNIISDLKEIQNHINCSPSICIDVANGYMEQVTTFLKLLRKEFPDSIIMVGNVCTGLEAVRLVKNGADIIKCGIGPGSVCLTRKQTGVGRPQLSTIIECANFVHDFNGLICADGGITCPGDICKAFGAGADFVMTGNLYAGSYEAEGDIIEQTQILSYDNITKEPIYHTKKYKKYYGMSSFYAQDKFYKERKNYRTSEGRVALVPYTSTVKEINQEILGGLRSCMTYIGAQLLSEISNNCNFYKVNNQLNTIYEKSTINN